MERCISQRRTVLQELSSSWDGRPFGHNRHGPKIGGVSLFLGGGAGPHLTQCRLDWGLPPYQVVSWSIQPFGHNRHGPKIGGCAPFLGSWVPIQHTVAGAETYLHAKFHLDPCNRLATIHQRHRQDRTDRTDRQTTVRYDRASKLCKFCIIL